MRMIRRIWLETEDEGLVHVIIHEVFHYLRRTKK
jgi:predicted SprT family Zn-dependent metalloprotease